MNYEFVLISILCVTVASCLYGFVVDYTQMTAHEKTINCREDVDKLLTPHKLKAIYEGKNCWTVYDRVHNRKFVVKIPANKFLALLRLLKHKKTTIEDFRNYLKDAETKHIKKLQKSKEL